MTAAAAGGLQTEVVATLIANGDGWRRAWPACTNAATDPYGNRVSVHHDRRGETLYVEFEYALGGVVETLNLSTQHGAARIAAVIQTLAAAPADDRADR